MLRIISITLINMDMFHSVSFPTFNYSYTYRGNINGLIWTENKDDSSVLVPRTSESLYFSNYKK
jgi:hypothetical protein